MRHGLARLALGHDPRQLEVRMTGEKSEHFTRDVAGGRRAPALGSAAAPNRNSPSARSEDPR